ncbi:MAG: hypothetical protein AB199_04405 [Parcubacteria bacterium C7867-004]|nr:MAG: hypothetical protein AB199_04405 [Parcubacteria bacterium C7867-004]
METGIAASAPRSRKPLYIGLGVAFGIVLIIALAIGLYVFTPAGGPIRLQIFEAGRTEASQKITFVSDREIGKTTLYRYDGTAKETEVVESSIVSTVERENGAARIMQRDGIFQVVVDGTVVIEDQTPRIGIDRSPDGTRIVFAKAIDASSFVSPAESFQSSVDRRSWEVIVYEPATKSTITLGTGASPFFVDDTHIALMTLEGLAIRDLESEEMRIVIQDERGRVSAVTLVSPDHSVFAWYAAGSKTLRTYKVTAGGATLFSETEVPGKIRSLSLGDDALYLLQGNGWGVDVLKQPFGEKAERIGSLPSQMGVSRILLGSL